MKQIDIIKTYAQKRCLVVDDIPDVRAMLKRILVDFGCSEVDTAGHAEEAIELCEKHHYDIVLSDYNLGKGKNGQQLLEELRFHGLLQNTALYVIITAEMTSQHVINTLEYQPDDYLNKQINRDSLRPRLDLALLKNEALFPIKKALDNKQPKEAIAACKQLLTEKSRFQNDALRMLGELLCDNGLHQEAHDILQKFPETKRPLWAQLIFAQSLIGMNHTEQAETCLLGIIQENQYCIDAYDLLAELYRKQDKSEKAQHILAKGVHIAPMSARRQRSLGKVSQQLHDDTTAVLAFRSALKHSKNSCHESAEDYTSLAQNLISQIQKKHGDHQLEGEAWETLQHAKKRYPNHPVVQMRCKLLEADFYDAKQQRDFAQQACDEALNINKEMKISVIEKTSVELSIDCARSLMARGKYDEGEKLLQAIARTNKDPELAIAIDKLLRDPVTKEGILFASELNKKGIEHYRAQRTEEAIKAFCQVLDELPNHIGLNLNLIQALISKSKLHELSDDEFHLIDNSIQRIGKLEASSPYHERYAYITKRFDKLKQDREEQPEQEPAPKA